MTTDFSHLSVLIVDDDPTMRSAIASALRSAGCNTVRQASNGDRALEVVRQGRVDLITCDCQMSPMDGLTFVRHLRRTAEGATKPVIMLTASNRPEDAWAGRELKVAAWLVKPITPQSVIKQIAAVLGISAGAPVPEDVLAELATAYEKRLPAEIQVIDAVAQRLKSRPEAFDDTVHELVTRLHVVKGQAGTLGYALLGAVAGEIHNVLQQAERHPSVTIGFRAELQKLVHSGFQVLRLIVEKNVRGGAGAVGIKVLGDIATFADPLRARITAAADTEDERIAAVTDQASLTGRQQQLLAQRRIRLHQADADAGGAA